MKYAELLAMLQKLTPEQLDKDAVGLDQEDRTIFRVQELVIGCHETPIMLGEAETIND